MPKNQNKKDNAPISYEQSNAREKNESVFSEQYNPYKSETKSTSLPISTVIIILAFFVGGFFVGSLWKENQLLRSGNQANVLGETEQTPPEPEMNLEALPAITDADYVRGNAKAKVMLVEYGDFECPFCGRFHPTTTQILDEYKDKIGIAYRHYPLGFHPNAQKAAEAAECVGKQKGDEGFWTFADSIFEVTQRDGQLSAQAITDAAQSTGVNMSAFQSCLDSGEMTTKVQEQMSAGALAGVQGTPGTFIVVDGKAVDFISGALPFEQIKATLDGYIN